MDLSLPKPTEIAVPLFVIAVVIEVIFGLKKGRVSYEGRDTLTSLTMGLGSTISGLLFSGFFAGLAYFVWENYRLYDLGHAPWVFVIAFVLDDLRYYWVHRFGHRMRWMWAAHVIHHSSQHYNLSTALRQTWTGFLTPGFLFGMPLFVLGIEPAIIAFCAGLNLIYQFWIHTEAIDKCPKWFEAVMNTPSHHRVHHSTNPRYLDSNYAGVFIIWDRLFGTFVAERKDDPCRYGLVSDLGTFNPLRVAAHEWVAIAKDWIAASGWKDRVNYLIQPPGWTPDGSRKTTEILKEDWEIRRKAGQKEKAKGTAEPLSGDPISTKA